MERFIRLFAGGCTWSRSRLAADEEEEEEEAHGNGLLVKRRRKRQQMGGFCTISSRIVYCKHLHRLPSLPFHAADDQLNSFRRAIGLEFLIIPNCYAPRI